MIRRLIVVTLGVLAVLGVAVAGALYWILSGDGVRLALERQATTWLGAPVSIGRATAQLIPRPAIALEDVRAGSGLTLAHVELSAPLQSLLARRIENADVLITRSRVAMPLPFAMPAAARPAPVTGAGGTAPALLLVSIRSIRLRDVVLVSRGRDIAVNADASLLRSQLQLRQLTATTASTALEATGIVELEPSVDARLRVKATRVDVDELLALASAFSPPAGIGDAARRLPARIAARVSAETATAGGISLRQFATEFQAAGDEITLSPLTFQLFGGRFQGGMTGRLGAGLDISLRSRLLNLDVAQLAAPGGTPATVTGRLSGSGIFAGSGRDIAAVLRSLRGTGDIAIANGTLRGLNLVQTVMLFFGGPDPGGAAASDAFDTFNARLSVAGPVVTATALSMHSKDADVVGEGALALETTAVSGRLDLSLSETLSAKAGTDQTRYTRYTREGNRIVLPAILGGSLGQPGLKIDAAAAVAPGFKDDLQRRLADLLGQLNRERGD